MKIGIIGGTFNPIHIAHLRIAEEVRDRLALDRVVFMPAAAPPHKPLAGELSFGHRYAMVELAIADNPAFTVSDLEGKRGGTSYSIHTLTELGQMHPEDELFFIIGSDSFLEIASWYRYQELFACCNMVVVERPGGEIRDLAAALPAAVAGEFVPADSGRLDHRSGFSVHYLAGIPLAISSSAIRELAHTGHSLRYLVSDAVARYITEQRIYADVR